VENPYGFAGLAAYMRCDLVGRLIPPLLGTPSSGVSGGFLWLSPY
jgi:hypothetical protein